jgi:hypothetical protein
MGSRWAWACAAERKGPWREVNSQLAGYGSVRPLELLPDEEIEMRSGMDVCEAADEQAEGDLYEHGAEEEKAGPERVGRSSVGRRCEPLLRPSGIAVW